MVRNIGGGVEQIPQRRDRRVGDRGRPLTSDYTKPHPLLFFLPSGQRDKRAAAWQSLHVCVCVDMYMCVCLHPACFSILCPETQKDD